VIGKHTLLELFHVGLGIATAAIMARLAAWAYPLARTDIWVVAIIAMLGTAAASLSEIRKAMMLDRGGQPGAGQGE